MKRRYKSLVTLLLFIFFCWGMDRCGNYKGAKRTIAEIQDSYASIVIDTFYYKVKQIRVKTLENREIVISSPMLELANKASPGDSIIKIGGENYCYLVKDTIRLKLPYRTILESYRETNIWPKAWKERWPESTW